MFGVGNLIFGCMVMQSVGEALPLVSMKSEKRKENGFISSILMGL